ncbi:unnamed protein product [Linum trigynum]|uniref:Secreted protein n=1 Tax=Linum trigynum TaxID=586398 RepID=A0AAV2ELD6_9ROSI
MALPSAIGGLQFSVSLLAAAKTNSPVQSLTTIARLVPSLPKHPASVFTFNTPTLGGSHCTLLRFRPSLFTCSFSCSLLYSRNIASAFLAISSSSSLGPLKT